jgi:hypothetical protein
MDVVPIRDRLGYGVIGLVLAIPAFVGNAVGFYFVLATCRKENATSFPATCPHGDHKWDALAFGGVLGIALALPLLGLLGMRPRALLGVGLVGWAFWLAYTLALFGT